MVCMVKVVNIVCTPSIILFDASIAEMNLRDLRSTVDLNSDKSRCFNHRDELDSIVQLGHSTRVDTILVSMHTINIVVCLFAIQCIEIYGDTIRN